jgi:hypothetical protein
LLQAYGSCNWGIFQSVIIPSTNYVVNEHALEKLSSKLGLLIATTPLDEYHEIWTRTIAKDGLINEVSFVDDSISILKLPIEEVSHVGLPEFTSKTNQNWALSVPAKIFDYRKTELANLHQAEVLRFFFFGKAADEVNPYMVTFVWDTNGSVWLPWRMTVAMAGTLPKPGHQIMAF